MNTLNNPKINSKKKKAQSTHKDSHSLFVGGFSCSTTHFAIKQIFSNFGHIKKIKMIKNRKGGSKGYCYILYKQIESVQNALKSGDLWCNKRKLSCRPILKGDQLKAYTQEIDKKRISCSNLPEFITEETKNELKVIFEGYGDIENFYFALGKDGNPDEINSSNKAELFISFVNIESVDKILDAQIFFKEKILKIQPFRRKKYKTKEEEAKEKKDEEKNQVQVQKNQVRNPKVSSNGIGTPNQPINLKPGDLEKLNSNSKTKSTLELIISKQKSLNHSHLNIWLTKKEQRRNEIHSQASNFGPNKYFANHSDPNLSLCAPQKYFPDTRYQEINFNPLAREGKANRRTIFFNHSISQRDKMPRGSYLNQNMIQSFKCKNIDESNRWFKYPKF